MQRQLVGARDPEILNGFGTRAQTLREWLLESQA